MAVSIERRKAKAVPSVKAIGEVLRSIRTAKRITQPQLEELTGLTQTTISDVENGRRRHWENIALMADGLGTPVEEVIRAARLLETAPSPVQQLVAALSESADLLQPELMGEFFAKAAKM